jgi:hypothetical protein
LVALLQIATCLYSWGGLNPNANHRRQTYHEWRNLQCQTPFQVRSPWTFSLPCPPPTNIYPRKIKVANAIASIPVEIVSSGAGANSGE